MSKQADALDFISVLIVDDDADHMPQLVESIGDIPEVCEVRKARTFDDADKHIDELVRRPTPTVILLDVYLRADNSEPSLDLFRKVWKSGLVEQGLAEVIVTTATADDEIVRQFEAVGRFEYIDKLAVMQARTGITRHVRNALSAMRRRYSVCYGPAVARTADDFGLPEDLVPSGCSEDLLRIYDDVRRRVRDDRALKVRPIYFVYGETGTGKEWVTKAIHHWAGADRPLETFNIKDLSATDIQTAQARLYGYARGFQGRKAVELATADNAKNGTLMIDDLQEMDPQTKSWLLRFFDDGRGFLRVGGGDRGQCEAQIVITSNRPLEQLRREGIIDLQTHARIMKFGEPIELPSLADRGADDIIAWCNRFMTKWATERNCRSRLVLDQGSEAVIRQLPLTSWAGNIRAVESVANAIAKASNDTVAFLNSPDAAVQHVVPVAIVREVIGRTRFQCADEPPPLTNAWQQLGFSKEDGERYQYYLDEWNDPLFKQRVMQHWTQKRPPGFNLKQRNDYLATVEALIRARGVIKDAAALYGRERQNFYRNLHIYQLDAKSFKVFGK